MPRDRKTPQEQAQLEAANRRIEWLRQFNEALVKLRPHHANSTLWLKQVGTSELKRAGLEADPAKVAKAWHEANKARQ